ncbi:uncharacterized protein LOC110826021 isoform X1 [Carica papaya]|uniref:uncharacterized protein LOC110826021 isoform X1 n=1 Tax=Carica papaya TaxID=3649 RepID=UPI000B8C6E3C|nr:uncharacterized protein LOC110826021 isoform X1 [Carica papaya]
MLANNYMCPVTEEAFYTSKFCLIVLMFSHHLKLSFTFRNLAKSGLNCQVLSLMSSHFRKLNMSGEFMWLHALILDHSSTLNSFQEDCFSCMPNLIHLSACDTRVGNLWTTIAALSRLPSLLELRFQSWLGCNGSGPSISSDGYCGSDFSQLNPYNGTASIHDVQRDLKVNTEAGFRNLFPLNNVVMDRDFQNPVKDSSDDSEMDFLSHIVEHGYYKPSSSTTRGLNREADQQDGQVSFGTLLNQDEEEESECACTRHIADAALKFVPSLASPICFEKHYREYMIASLPQLKVLDNLPIRNIDRESAATTFSQYFEYLPYRRKHKESVISVLQNRELKSSYTNLQTPKRKASCHLGKSQYFYTRSLSAAKVGSSAWPFLHPLSILSRDLVDEKRRYRPRQFEYHPSISSLMVFGTLDGEVIVVNHENEKVVSYIPSLGAMNSVLGLCWLKKHPYKLIAGSDNGSLKLYDIQKAPTTVTAAYNGMGSVTFDVFDQLTSVHINSTDEIFLASGYSKDVALYDIASGRRLQVFTNMHQQHINVVKFANHSPSLFATSSFDQDVKLWDLRQKPIFPCYTASSTKGNVMVCFSPDDHYLLVSAVDNEVPLD